jgi:hypothetical protein
LREGESPVLPGEKREKEGEKGWGLSVGLFYTILNLDVGSHYIITGLLSSVD